MIDLKDFITKDNRSKEAANSHFAKYFDALNRDTKKHSEEVKRISEGIADRLGLDKKTAGIIGLVHDIGKVYVAPLILEKDARLSPLERQIVDQHSYYGYVILKECGFSAEIYIPVLFHHSLFKTHLDSIAEPVTEEMITYTRIVHVADIYEARSSFRAYHKPVADDVIYEDLTRNDFLSTPDVLSALKEWVSKERGEEKQAI